MRDPNPVQCQHKRACHEHGTYACYVLDKCGCRPCRDAANAYGRDRARQHAYGRFDARFVPGEQVRAHLAALANAGVGLKRVGELANIHGGTLTKLVYGHPRENGTTRPPATRVTRAVAERILGLDPTDPALLAGGAKIDPTGTRRRVQALVARGWSVTAIGVRLGRAPANFHRTLNSDHVTVATRDAIKALYDALWDTPPPQATKHEKIAAARARNYAAARGWPPPLAWDDDTIDDPHAVPHDGHQRQADCDPGVDEVAIQRALHGAGDEPLTRAERDEALRRLNARGHSDQEIARRLRITDRTVLRRRAELGIPAARSSA